MHKTHTILGPFLEAEMLKKCTLLWRETHFEVNNGKKKMMGSEHVWTFRSRFAWQVKGSLHFVINEEKRRGRVAFPDMIGGVGHLKKIWKDAFRVAGAMAETCSSEMLRGQGVDFLKRVAF